MLRGRHPEQQQPPPGPPDLRSYGQVDIGNMVFELHAGFGRLESALQSLERSVDKGFSAVDKRLDGHQKSLDWIRRIMWMVTGGAIVGGIIFGFIVEHGFDKFIGAFTKAG